MVRIQQRYRSNGSPGKGQRCCFFEPLEYRDRSALPWIGTLKSAPKLLLDTTVYIDQLQARLPGEVATPWTTIC